MVGGNNKFPMVSGILGLMLTAAGGIAYAIMGEMGNLPLTLIWAGVLLIVFFAYTQLSLIQKFVGKRSTIYGANTFVMTLVFLIIIVMVAYMSVRHKVRVDLTDTGRYTLAPQTVKTLRSLPGDVELCRVYIIQSKAFGSEIGGLYGAASYIPEAWDEFAQLRLGYYAAATALVAALVLFRFINGKRLGRLLRMAPEKREAFAEATGVNYRVARIQVFLISSAALGVIGAFYASHFRGASPNLFGFDTVAMGLAMLVIGGLGRAEGAVLGTLIVVFIDRVLIDLGPLRIVLIGVLMLFVVLFLRGGVFGIKAQFRVWRDKKKSENRSARAEKGGEMLPEEATEVRDKDELAFRRYDKNQRDFLKTLVSDEVIEEFKNKPLGQHSEALERLLTYFRRQPMVDKYAIKCVEPFKAYQIVALSGISGVPPRLVEDKIYSSREDAWVGVFTRRIQDLLES